MPIEDNLPWQKWCERARRILADCIQKCLGYPVKAFLQVLLNQGLFPLTSFFVKKSSFPTS